MGACKRGDYPRNLGDFYRRLPDEAACFHYLVETRWPDGFRCPACGSEDARFMEARRTWQCRACRKQTSATAGTVLHRSKLPLTLWFTAAYLMTSLKPGISALQLEGQLGLTRFETAWFLLHKLRRAIVAEPSEPPTQPDPAAFIARLAMRQRRQERRSTLPHVVASVGRFAASDRG